MTVGRRYARSANLRLPLAPLLLLLTGLLSLLPPAALARAERDNWALEEPEWAQPGPYRLPLHQDFVLGSFAPDQRLVGTYFFYWFMADVYRQRIRERGFDSYIYHPTDT